MTISGLTRQKLARALGSQSDASSICDLLDSGEVGTARDSAIRRLSYALGSQSAATAVEASLELLLHSQRGLEQLRLLRCRVKAGQCKRFRSIS